MVVAGLNFSQDCASYIQNAKMSSNSFPQTAKGALIILGVNAVLSLVSGLILSTCCFSNSCSSQWNTPGLLCGISLISLAFIGVIQLVYVLPYGIWLRRRGRSETLKGIMIGAVITVLINGGCFVVLVTR